MKISNIALTAAVLFSTTAAQGYQLFSEVGYQRVDTNYSDSSTLWGSGKYYFNDIQALGPLAEFDYLITKSNVSAYYNNYERGSDEFQLGGEVFYKNFLVGADVRRSDSGYDTYNTSTATLGYLIQPNWLVKARYQDHYRGGEAYFSTRYTHNLGATDYIGFNLTVNDDFDYFSGSSRYFTALGGDTYLATELNFSDNDSDTAWGLAGDYYFNPTTSVGVGYQDLGGGNSFSLRARHYFTSNWALAASYSSLDDSDANIYQVSLIGQF